MSDGIIDTVHRERLAIQLWQTVGASKLANQIVSSLGSQSLHALERVRDEKLYLAAGFETFAEFLDHHPDSPMGHDTFRRRVNLLNSEGEIAFDLLNSLNVPLSKRKMLAGNIAVDGDEIEIAGTKARLDDKPRIIEIITLLASKSAEQQRTIERGKKDVEKYKRQRDEAQRNAVITNPDGTETGQAILGVAGSIARLREALKAAPEEEKRAAVEPIFNLLSYSQLELSVDLGVVKREEVPDVEDQGDESDDDAQMLEDL